MIRRAFLTRVAAMVGLAPVARHAVAEQQLIERVLLPLAPLPKAKGFEIAGFYRHWTTVYYSHDEWEKRHGSRT